jgi:hypothetical protein
MDYSISLKYLNIFLTTFFSFILALFTILQWKAVKKQNNINLFKMRLEHCTKIRAILLDLLAVKDDIEKIKLILLKFEKIMSDSYYLFNEIVYNCEKNLFDEINKIIELSHKGNVDKYNHEEFDKNAADFESEVSNFLLKNKL